MKWTVRAIDDDYELERLFNWRNVVSAIGAISLGVAAALSRLTAERCAVTSEPWGSMAVFAASVFIGSIFLGGLGKIHRRALANAVPFVAMLCGVVVLAYVWPMPYRCITFVGIR